MNVINIPSRIDRAESLETLWAEAASLGGVRLWMFRRLNHCEAVISFELRSGTSIEAKAKDVNPAFALAAAINEARSLGAGWDSL